MSVTRYWRRPLRRSALQPCGRHGVRGRWLWFTSCLFLAACGGGAPSESTLDRITRTGVVRVGFANEAPYAYMDPQTGMLSGEAPAVARLVLRDLGVDQIEGVLTEFGALIPGLKAGRFDMIAAGMYITPARCREIAFSNPTYKVNEGFLVTAGNPMNLHSYADVREHSDARLGVVAGTVELGYARTLAIPSERLIVLPDNPSALAALEARRIDAYAGTALTLTDLLQRSGTAAFELATPFENPVIDGQEQVGYGAFGLRPQDAELLAAINERLKQVLGTEAHQQAVAPFGFSEATLPGAVQAETLCAAEAAVD